MTTFIRRHRKEMRGFAVAGLVLALAAGLSMLLVGATGVFADHDEGAPYEGEVLGDNNNPNATIAKIKICHATGSDSNPYSNPEVNINSFFSGGHDTDLDDVIPPFHYDKGEGAGIEAFPGMNWDADGEEFWENGCVGSDDPVLGCMDPEANNYNPDATEDDGSCTYDVLGCTDPEANNYDPEATEDDGSCTYDVLGCTNPDATNYNPDATVDDGSCVFEDPTGTIVVEKVVLEGGDTEQDFNFDASWLDLDVDFILAHGESQEFTVVAGSGYGVSEAEVDGWVAVSECSSTDEFDESTAGAIDVSEGETVTCVFTNRQEQDPEEPDTCEVVIVSDTTNTVQGGGNAVLTFVHDLWVEIGGAEWIWETDLVTDPEIDQSVTFEKSFNWNGTLVSAELEISSDNSYSFDVNSTTYEDLDEFNYQSVDSYDVTGDIVTGTNNIVATVENFGIDGSTAQSNPAGLLYKLTIVGEGDTCDTEPEPEEEILGCTDPEANNHNPNATEDDGSCDYNSGGGGGGGGGSRRSGGGGNDDDDEPEPQVLGAQVAAVPAGAPNTGFGGAAQAGMSLGAIVSMLLGLSGLTLARIRS